MSVKRMYDLVHVDNALEDGDVNMSSSELGMALDMKHVSFSYPGYKSDSNALHDVSFSIKPGQLVVIVGANGSGKSTMLKLFSRLYDCTAGQVVLDGKDIRDYKLASIRSATAILTQDHHIYPLSLSENIGVGNPQAVSDMTLIQNSAEKGGADAFISRRANKYDTVLEPMAVNYMGHVCSDTDASALTTIYQNFEKKTEISGGERQRVAASRTFMRLTSKRIKLVVADEPSSSLDPQGEAELFKNLIDERQGKTMIFVTHRFGQITKQADVILCMKDGRLVEQGTHAELIAMGDSGEYFKLYQIQARAFTET
ncbi:P-loop containing nucleoside triphosphate hydrolase protein [Mycena capillaripes]|nr:P-loop containing nucleoside triphosphate hydrolase protein [Mycena capillaripes]